MADLDLSDIITDSDFADKVSIIRRTAVVDQTGINIITEEIIETLGSVQPPSAGEVMRAPEGLRSKDLKSFWVRQELLARVEDGYPDVLVFNGRRFQIISVQNWNNFGTGYSQGICVDEGVAP